jgi:hypothetical protein
VTIYQVNGGVVCHKAILSDKSSDRGGTTSETATQKQQTLKDALMDPQAIGACNLDGSHHLALHVQQG